jgi:predicted dehydrogenase
MAYPNQYEAAVLEQNQTKDIEMQNDLSRRSFIKSAGVVAGAATVAGFSACSYAQNEKVRLGIIGTGAQGRIAHMGEGLRVHDDKIQIVALCDVWNLSKTEALKVLKDQGKSEVPTYTDYREMIEKEELDAVLVATPLYTHYQIVMDCLDADLYVFCEKTLTMTIEESRDIVKKCHEKGKFLQVGHQRRYNPYYNKAMWLTNDKNLIGRITHITAQWHRNESWRRIPPKDYVLSPEEQKYIPDLDKHVNWRLFNDMSAGLMTELGTHQLDVASWFLGGIPSKVSGFGGIDYWKDNRDAEDSVALIYEWDVKPGMQGFGTLDFRRSQKQRKTRLNSPYKVRMTYSSICTNSKQHYSELIQGDRGALELVGEQRCQIYPEKWYLDRQAAMAARKAGKAQAANAKTSKSYIPGEAVNEGIRLEVYTDKEQKSTKYDVWMANHNQWEAFVYHIKNGGAPKSNQMAGLVSSICGHKGNDAIRSGSTVDIDPALMAFDFETPDPFGFDKDVPGPDLQESMKKKAEEDAKKAAAAAAAAAKAAKEDA